MTLRLAVAVALLAFASAPGEAQSSGAQPITVLVRPSDRPGDIGQIVQGLTGQGRDVVVRIDEAAPPSPPPHAAAQPHHPHGASTPGKAASEAPAAAAPKAGAAPVPHAIPLWTPFLVGTARGIEGIPAIPRLAEAAGRAWRESSNAGLPILLVLGLGALAAAGAHAGLRRLAQGRLARPPGDFMERLSWAALRGAIDGAAILAFAVVGHVALSRLLPQPDFVRATGQALVHAVTVFGLSLAIGRFLLAPDRPARRLLPLAHPSWHWRMLVAYAALGPLAVQSVVLFERLGEPAAVTGWFLLASTLVAAVTIAWFWGGRHDIAALAAGSGTPHSPLHPAAVTDSGEAPSPLHRAAVTRSGEIPSPLRRAAAAALPWLYIAVAVLIWIIGRIAAEHPDGAEWGAAAGLTQIVVLLLPVLAGGAGALVGTLGERFLAQGATPGRTALVAVCGVVATSGIWIASLTALSGIWSEVLIDPDSEVAVLVLRAAVTVAASLVAAWALWTFLDTFFAAHAPRDSAMPGDEDEGQGPVSTRLATVLPLVRHLALGAIVAVTALAILAAIGVHIGPLLAGFGVIGLAISFGSQALVRDVVSGIFFMADDAFRVGEYIDTGKLKGTVEKITLRSVQLRHQNGPFHTVPYGQLQAVTNYSRDWSTIKFTIRLDRDADIEKARKVIKRVGLEMMEDPDFGPEFMQPLKMQGVQEIADSAIVVRCKFTSKPAKPTWLQREALKRIYRALQEAGVPFASSAVTVRSGTSPEFAAAASLAGVPPVAANAG